MPEAVISFIFTSLRIKKKKTNQQKIPLSYKCGQSA